MFAFARPPVALTLLIAAIAICAACSAHWLRNRPETPQTVSILFTHDLRGELEPCGCGSNPIGGFARRATAIDRFHGTWPERRTWLVDSGNLLFGESGKFEFAQTYYVRKVETMYRLSEMLGYDVMGLGGFDIGYPDRQLYEYVWEEEPRVPLVSASLDFRGGIDPAIERVVELEKDGILIAFTSITDAQPSSHLASGISLLDPLDAFDQTVAQMEGADLIVILASVDNETALQMANDLGPAGIVINRTNPEAIPETWPRNLISSQSLQGQVLGRVDLVIPPEGGWSALSTEFTVLEDTIEEDPDVMRAMKRFNRELADVNVIKPKGISPDMRRYGGVDVCKGCHTLQYQNWTDTAHAHAYETLVEANAEFNPECLKCHTTGYGEPFGFVNKSQAYDLSDVQCETCHGIESSMVHGDKALKGTRSTRRDPELSGMSLVETRKMQEELRWLRKITDRLVFLGSLEKTCKGCHTQEMSPEFNFKEWLPAVRCPLDQPHRWPEDHLSKP